MAEKQRIQGAEAKGAEFMYREQENRDLAQMDRLSTQLQGAEAREMQASADRSNAIAGAVGGIASTVGGMYQAGAFNPGPRSVVAAPVIGASSGLQSMPSTSSYDNELAATTLIGGN